MLDDRSFVYGAVRLALIGVLSLNLSPSVRAAEAAAKASPVKVTMTVQARKLLNKHRMTLKGGILRRRGAKAGQDIATGSGELYVIIHPENKNALAVGGYDRGTRYGALTIDFSSHEPSSKEDPNISPLGLSEEATERLFPKKR